MHCCLVQKYLPALLDDRHVYCDTYFIDDVKKTNVHEEFLREYGEDEMR